MTTEAEAAVWKDAGVWVLDDFRVWIEALKERWIAGAGLDDIEEEPVKQRDWKPANPLFGLDNVVITPHAACYSEGAIRTVRDFAAHELSRVLTGQPPLSPVPAAQLAIVRSRHSA